MSGIIKKAAATTANKESLTTKLTLIIVGLTAGSALLIPATYASFHPVTTGEIADNTILSVDIANGQVRTEDIGAGQIRTGDIADNAIQPTITTTRSQVIVPAGGYAFAKAICPGEGRVLSGGGYSASPYFVIYQNMPYNETTWHITAYNSETQNQPVTVFAVCIGLTP